MSDTKIVYSIEKYRQGIVTEIAINPSTIEYVNDKRVAFNAQTLRGRHITVDVLAENAVMNVSGKYFSSYERALAEASIRAQRDAKDLAKKLAKMQMSVTRISALQKKNAEGQS